VVHSRINGYDLLVLANEDVGRSIHFGRDYEAAETRFLETVIAKTSTCMDIGANVGYFSLLMGRHSPQGKVYAFEPIPLNAALLRASIELNGFDNIEVIESAVGAADGEVTFSQSIDSAYSSMRDTERKPVERSLNVSMTTLDTFIRQRSIPSVDVLKIDVEGAEGLVVDGAKSLLGDPTRKPRLVFMELYEPNLAPFKTRASTIIDTMHGFGYTAFFVNDKSELIPFSEEKLTVLYNVFFLSRTWLSSHG
jgi:FkbM family methyltransferase